MKSYDSTTLWTAVVDRDKVTTRKLNHIGIDYSNEIDAWAQMVFIYRRQILSLKTNGTCGRRQKLKDDQSLYYALRVRAD